MPKFYQRDRLGNPVQTDDPVQAAAAQGIGNKPIGEAEALEAANAQRNLSYVDQNWGSAGKLAAGVGSGLTLGLGPGLLARAGLIDPGILSAAEQSPLYTVGDVAGTALPAFLSGGEGALARGAAMTPAGMMTGAGGLAERLAGGILGDSAGLMGRMASAPIKMAARGAAEGALINMGHTVGDGLIHDVPLSAESIAASGLDGALFGGLMGAGLGSVSALGDAAAEGVNAFAKKSMGGSGGVAKIAKRIGMGSEGVGSTLEEGQSNMMRYGKGLEEGGSSLSDSVPGMQRGALNLEETSAKTRSSVIDDLNKSAPDAVPDLARIEGRLTDTVATDAKRAGIVQKWVDSLKSETHVPGISEEGIHIPGEVVKTAEGKMPSGKTHFSEKVTPEINRPGVELPGFTESKPLTWKELVSARDQLEAQVSRSGGKYNDVQASLAGDKIAVKREILNAIDDEIRMAMEGTKDRLPGIAEKYAGATQGLKTAQELKVALGKKAADQMLSTGHGLNTHDFSSFGMSAALGHPVGAGLIIGAKLVGRRINQLTEPWMAQMAYNNMIGTKAAGATLNVQSRIAKSLGNFFKNASKVPNKTAQTVNAERSAKTPGPDRAQYEAYANRMEELTSEAHQAKVRAYIDSVAHQGFPQLAAELAGVNARAVQYVIHTMPSRKGTKNMTSLRPIPVSKTLDFVEHKFQRIGKGISGPLSALDSLENGSISRDEIRAAAYTYPAVWGPGGAVAQGIAEKVVEMKQNGDSIPMDKVYLLGCVLNSAIDSTLQPDYIAAVQTSLNSAPLTGQPQQAPPPPTNVQMNNALLTPTQKVMG